MKAQLFAVQVRELALTCCFLNRKRILDVFSVEVPNNEELQHLDTIMYTDPAHPVWSYSYDRLIIRNPFNAQLQCQSGWI